MGTKIPALVAALALASGVAACGSSSSSSGSSASSTPAASSSTASSTPASTGGASSAMTAQVATDEKAPATFPGPTTAFAPGSHKAMVIACGFQAPVCPEAAKQADAAVKAMGWTSSGPLDGKLSPQTQAGLITQAIQQNDNAIVMYGIDVNSIKAPIEQALAKKIAISCILCTSGSLRGQVIDVGPDFTHEGVQIADSLIAKNGGKAKVVVFEDTAFPQTVFRTNGLVQTLKGCSGCSVTVKPESVAETAQPGPPAFTALLSATPAGSGSVTDVVALYDGIAQPMATTLKSQGRTDLQISSYDAELPVVQAIQNGSLPIHATVAPPINYAAWAAVDEVGRKVAGKPTWDGTALPAVVVDKTNAAKYATNQVQPAGDWKAHFLKLWGK